MTFFFSRGLEFRRCLKTGPWVHNVTRIKEASRDRPHEIPASLSLEDLSGRPGGRAQHIKPASEWMPAPACFLPTARKGLKSNGSFTLNDPSFLFSSQARFLRFEPRPGRQRAAVGLSGKELPTAPGTPDEVPSNDIIGPGLRTLPAPATLTTGGFLLLKRLRALRWRPRPAGRPPSSQTSPAGLKQPRVHCDKKENLPGPMDRLQCPRRLTHGSVCIHAGSAQSRNRLYSSSPRFQHA